MISGVSEKWMASVCPSAVGMTSADMELDRPRSCREAGRRCCAAAVVEACALLSSRASSACRAAQNSAAVTAPLRRRSWYTRSRSLQEAGAGRAGGFRNGRCLVRSGPHACDRGIKRGRRRGGPRRSQPPLPHSDIHPLLTPSPPPALRPRQHLHLFSHARPSLPSAKYRSCQPQPHPGSAQPHLSLSKNAATTSGGGAPSCSASAHCDSRAYSEREESREVPCRVPCWSALAGQNPESRMQQNLGSPCHPRRQASDPPAAA